MNITTIFIICWFIIIAFALSLGMNEPFHRWFFTNIDNWIDKRRQIRRLFKYHSTHTKKYDWLKFYSLVIVIFLAVIIISGISSHFGTVARAKKVCYTRLGTKDCNTINEHNYFIPGTKAGLFDFPYKLGITYKCGCNDNSKTIMMNMITKTETVIDTDKDTEVYIEAVTGNLTIIGNSTIIYASEQHINRTDADTISVARPHTNVTEADTENWFIKDLKELFSINNNTYN